MKRLFTIAAPFSVAAMALTSHGALAQDGANAATAMTASDVVSAADHKGRMLYDADGKRLGAVYGAAQDGSARVIMSGRMILVPASTLAVNGDNKLATSMSRRDLMRR